MQIISFDLLQKFLREYATFIVISAKKEKDAASRSALIAHEDTLEAIVKLYTRVGKALDSGPESTPADTTFAHNFAEVLNKVNELSPAASGKQSGGGGKQKGASNAATTLPTLTKAEVSLNGLMTW
jgi:flagellar hook-basal body complex protein FliE